MEDKVYIDEIILEPNISANFASYEASSSPIFSTSRTIYALARVTDCHYCGFEFLFIDNNNGITRITERIKLVRYNVDLSLLSPLMLANWLAVHDSNTGDFYREFIAENYYKIIKDAFENFYESPQASDTRDKNSSLFALNCSHLTSIRKLVSYYNKHCNVWEGLSGPSFKDVASKGFPKYGAFINKAYP